MNVLFLIGSLRKASVNRMLATAFAKELSAEASYADISDFPLYSQDIQDQGMPACVLRVAQQIRDADAIVFATPEYNYSVPGVLKNAIDWLSRVENQPFQQKTALIMGASPGQTGTARAQYHLRQIGVFLDLNFLNKPEVMVGGAYGKFDDNGNLTDEATRAHLAKAAEALRKKAFPG